MRYFPWKHSPPPGEPNGGVVYLRIVLSPEQASHLWMFLNNVFYREGLLAPRPTPKLEDHPSSAVRDCFYRWRRLVSAVMNLRVPWNAGNFLTICKPVSCSGRTLHRGVSKYISLQRQPLTTAQTSPKSHSTPCNWVPNLYVVGNATGVWRATTDSELAPRQKTDYTCKSALPRSLHCLFNVEI